MTTVHPDGTTTTVPLDSLSSGTGTGTGSSWDAYTGLPYEEELYDSSDLFSGTGTSNGSPTSPGMMPPRMGAAGAGDDGSAERQRSVLSSDITNRGPRPQPGVPYQDDIGVPQRAGTTGSPMPPMMPPMAGTPQQNGNESGDRQRTAWVLEEEDVWGIDEGGAPTAIGR
ncbi:hypothetical protein M8H82_30470 [Streptomyces sp. YS415]|nr:hypothetical protein [Streptomyces sp. YS415]